MHKHKNCKDKHLDGHSRSGKVRGDGVRPVPHSGDCAMEDAPKDDVGLHGVDPPQRQQDLCAKGGVRQHAALALHRLTEACVVALNPPPQQRL